MKEQSGMVVYSRWTSSLLRLATPKDLLQLLPFRKASLLWLWRGQPWSPKVSSSREGRKTPLLKALTCLLFKPKPSNSLFNNEKWQPSLHIIQRPGLTSFRSTVFAANILISPKASLRVLTLEYRSSMKHTLRQMILPSINFWTHTWRLLRGNSLPGGTLVPSQNGRLRTSLVPFSLRHSLSCLSQKSQINTKQCIISLIRVLRHSRFARSTHQSMQTTILVHMVLLLPSVSLFHVFQRVPKRCHAHSCFHNKLESDLLSDSYSHSTQPL
jgi:hypothetical protein